MILTRAASVFAVVLCGFAAEARADSPEQDRTALDAAYKRLLVRPHPHYLVPALELFTAISGGMSWYWIDRDRQIADWDFPSIKQRFTGDAWKYDTNPFPINFAWHAFDGAQYHLFARSCDLSLLESMAFGVGTSVLWEFTVEFREQVSINDVILTTASGTAMGEFLHWLGRYFESAPDARWWHPVPRWTLTTLRAGHNALFGLDRLRRGTAPDRLGFSSDIWHRFVIAAGVAHARLDGDLSPNRVGSRRPALARLVATGHLAAIPGYLTASVLERNFANANVSSARIRIDGGDQSFALDFGVDSFLIGHHRQRLPETGGGNASTIGVNLAYRYRRELLGPYVQRLAQTHLPGLAFDHHLRLGDAAWLRARVRANIDFVGVHALAYRTWRSTQPENILDTGVFRKHKYYFGYGPSSRLDLVFSRPSLAIGGSFGVASYSSHEGYDREQANLDYDLVASDRIVDWDAFVRIGSPLRTTFLEARVEQHRRTNSVEDVTERTNLTTFTLSFGTEQ